MANSIKTSIGQPKAAALKAHAHRRPAPDWIVRDEVQVGAQTPDPSLSRMGKVLFGKPFDIHVKWTTRLEDDPARHPSQEQPAYSIVDKPDGSLIVNGTRGTYGVSPDGTVAWHLETGYCPNPPVLDKDGTLYVNSITDKTRPDDLPKLTAARDDGQGMHVLWNRTEDDGNIIYPPTSGADGRLYTASSHHLLISDKDGSNPVDIPMEDLSPHRPIPLADGHMLLHVSNGVALFQPPTATSEARIEKVYGWQDEWPVKVLDDGTSFWWNDRTLRCVAPDQKTERWKYDFDPTGKSAKNRDQCFPVMTFADDGSIYAVRTGTLSGTEVTALTADGVERWKWTPVGDHRWAGTTPNLSHKVLVDADGNTYYSGNDVIYAVDPNGKQMWQERYEGTCNELSLGPRGTLVASDPSSHLRIMRRRDGALQWTSDFVLGHGYPSTRVVGDTIYTATREGDLISVQCRDAIEKLAEEPTPDPTRDPKIEKGEQVVIIDGVKVTVRRR